MWKGDRKNVGGRVRKGTTNMEEVDYKHREGRLRTWWRVTMNMEEGNYEHGGGRL